MPLLAPVINAATVKNLVTVASATEAVPIKAIAKRHDGAIYIFAAAMRDGSSSAVISVDGLKAGATVEVIGENRTLTAAAGSFADRFLHPLFSSLSLPWCLWRPRDGGLLGLALGIAQGGRSARVDRHALLGKLPGRFGRLGQLLLSLLAEVSRGLFELFGGLVEQTGGGLLGSGGLGLVAGGSRFFGLARRLGGLLQRRGGLRGVAPSKLGHFTSALCHRLLSLRVRGPVLPAGEPRFSTHSLSPETVLSMAWKYLEAMPEAYILAIRGEDFGGFGEGLSDRARRNLSAALGFIEKFLEERTSSCEKANT